MDEKIIYFRAMIFITLRRHDRVNLGFSSASWVLFRTKSSNIFELVHGVVTARGFEGSLSGKVFFVIISNVGTSHVLRNNNEIDKNVDVPVYFSKKANLQSFETKKKIAKQIDRYRIKDWLSTFHGQDIIRNKNSIKIN